ncbi:MAG: molybdenum cofactor guanylyltransferase [Solirubrobacterales bacterium]
MDPQPPGLIDNGVAAAVLAGGAASRMNGEKAGALLGARPLAEYPVRALRQAGLTPFLVTKDDRPVSMTGIETVIEPPGPRHPLLGITTALRAASGSSVLVVACDLPLLPPTMLAWMAEQQGPSLIPRVNGQLQPLAALYRPESLEVIEAGLRRNRSVKSTVLDLDPVFIEETELSRFGDPETSFHNVNTPADLAWAENHLASR